MGFLEGWLIIRAHGDWFIGKGRDLNEGAYRHLAPVFNLRSGVQLQAPQGPGQAPGMVISHQVTPVCWLASIKEMPIPPDSFIIPCEDLSSGEQKRLLAEISQCEEFLKGMRAADAGITLAKPNEVPPLPPQLRAVK